MRTKTKIWLGVGAFVVIETAATGGNARLGLETFAWLSARLIWRPWRRPPAGCTSRKTLITLVTRARAARPELSPACRPNLPLPCALHSYAAISWSATNWSSSSNGTPRFRISFTDRRDLRRHPGRARRL
jgi:hypothetical protein